MWWEQMPMTISYKISMIGLWVVMGFFALLSYGCDSGKADSKSATFEALPISVKVEVLRETEMWEYRTLSGDVIPWKILPLTFTVGGRVAKVSFDEGDQVRKGQLLAVLDSIDYKLMRDLAKVQVDALNPHMVRALKLKDSGAVTQAQLDELESKMSAARIQKSQADRQLSYARLTAPADGIVLQRKVSPGDMTDPEHPAGILAELKRVKVILPVSQRDLPLFNEGATVELTVHELTQHFTGKVHSIGYAADSKTRTFPVTLDVANDDLILRAGMIIEAHLKVASHKGIFAPLDAVSRSLDGQPSILIVDPKTKRAVVRRLTLGTVVGDKVLVQSGLEVGARIIVRGLVSEGDSVKEVSIATTNKPDAIE
jgi:RND family efflux transporter MFP subunit